MGTTKQRDGILICGAYGRGNAGDEAILRALTEDFRRTAPGLPIRVASRTPAETARDLGVEAVHPFDLPGMLRAMKASRLFLSGGGSLLQDVTSSRSLWYYLWTLRSAKRQGCRVMMIGCGIGPVNRPGNRRLTARVIRRSVDAVTLRDRASLRTLEALGVRDIPVRVTADPAFLVEPAPGRVLEPFLEAAGLPKDRPWLILAPRPWGGSRQYLACFAEAAVHAARTQGMFPVLLAMEPAVDHRVCIEIAELIRQAGVPCEAVDAPGDAGITAGLIRQAGAVLGMRLHALIFAAAQGTPFLGVSYDPKIDGFLAEAGCGACCSLEEVSTERLTGMLDRTLDTARDLEGPARRLRALAEENSRIAFGLMES